MCKNAKVNHCCSLAFRTTRHKGMKVTTMMDRDEKARAETRYERLGQSDNLQTEFNRHEAAWGRLTCRFGNRAWLRFPDIFGARAKDTKDQKHHGETWNDPFRWGCRRIHHHYTAIECVAWHISKDKMNNIYND